MKKILLSAALGLLATGAFADEALKVTYAMPGRGNRASAMRVVLTVDGNQCRTGYELDTALLLQQNPEWAERIKADKNQGKRRRGVTETQYIDYGTGKYYGVAEMPDGEMIATEQSSFSNWR